MMDAEQKAAFLSARCGFLTASRMAEAMGKKGPAARAKLLRALLAERLTGLSMRNVVTQAMQDGLDYEDEAADRFVEMTGRTLKLSRIYPHPTIEYFSCTPDRELDDGLVEIKCPTVETFVSWRLEGVVPEEHKPQMIAQCACTGKSWVGFLAYSPHIKDENKRLFMRKFTPEPHQIEAVETAARGFLAELDQMFAQFTETESA